MLDGDSNDHLVLGLDPGSLKTGFGLLRLTKEGQVFHVSHGAIVLDAKKTLAERIQDLAHDLTEIIGKYKPHSAVVEEVFFCKNARSALVLGQARGAALAVLGLYQVKTTALTPTAVKLMTVGHGRAQKYQVAQMVALTLNITVPSSEDASDALALALAHARGRRA